MPRDYTYTELLSEGNKPVYLTDNDIQLLFNQCQDIIYQTSIDHKLDLNDLSPVKWNICLLEINKQVFKPRPEIIRYYSIRDKSYKRGDVILQNLELIYGLYKDLCLLYGQIVSMYGLEILTGISDDVIMFWNTEKQLLNGKHSNLYKNIKHDRQEMLANRMLSDKGNPIKYMAILNHEYSWDVKKDQEERPERRVLSLDELPEYKRLELSDRKELPFFDDREEDD